MSEGAVGGMNPMLQEACERLRGLFGRGTPDEVTARYCAGTIVADVKRSKAKYGARAVERLAEALGQDGQTLYRCATVAECWTASQLEALLKRTTRHGQPLSWSHLVLLANVESLHARGVLIDRALRDRLSARKLAETIAGTRAGCHEQGIARLVARFVQKTDQCLHEVATLSDALRKELGAALCSQAALRALIETAISSQERLAAAAASEADRLRRERARLQSRHGPTLATVPRLP